MTQQTELNITIADLYAIIGKKQAMIEVLQSQLQQLRDANHNLSQQISRAPARANGSRQPAVVEG